MIFYFSGTGNSAWVARQLAEGQNEELLSIAMEIDRNKAYKLKEGEKGLSCNSWGIKFSQFPSCIYLC